MGDSCLASHEYRGHCRFLPYFRDIVCPKGERSMRPRLRIVCSTLPDPYGKLPALIHALMGRSRELGSNFNTLVLG